MVNDLIFIDGQEGFVNLDVLMKIRVSVDNMIRLELAGERIRHPFPCSPIIKNRITSLLISKNNIARCFYEIKGDYDSRIDFLIEGLGKVRQAIFRVRESKYRRRIKKRLRRLRKLHNRLNLNIRRISRNKRDCVLRNLDDNNFCDIISLLPQRFYSFVDEEYFFKKEGIEAKVVLSILKIRDIAVPFLEQQHQLGRIQLSKDQLILVETFKEAMKIKDENMTFDSYIDNWAKKLLKSFK